jgi:hypothetical protein
MQILYNPCVQNSYAVPKLAESVRHCAQMDFVPPPKRDHDKQVKISKQTLNQLY